MAGGWARVVRNENQLLDLVLVDIDDATDSKERLKHMLTKMILTWSNGAGRSSESEYCIDDGAVYIGRLLPDDDINEIFAMGDQQTTLVAMKDLPTLRMQTKSGRSEFHQDLPTPAAAPLHPEEVEIDVRAMGLAKGQGTVSADSGTSTLFNHEIAGLVTRAGSAVPPSIAVGDRVFGLSFDNSSTLQKTRHDLVRRMRQEETWENLATLPTASVTALYALEDLAQVQPTENVVVLDDCGIMGLIATQICVAKGAKPIMMGYPKHADSQLESFGTSVLAAMEPDQDITMSLERLLQGGRIDVILCSASVETRRLEECLKAAAPFARVVVLGTSTEPMSSLKISNASVTSFELRTLYQHKPGVVKRCVMSNRHP
jgi:NADPH:quinone reductase-like Zn-dependent oxidoreductase